MNAAASEDALNALRESLGQARSTRREPAGLSRVLWHEPGDMTVKVESGVKLSDLQDRVAGAGQWLPLDPWDREATIQRVIDENLHGPRRYGLGTVREHLLGMEILLADGRLVTSGGNVVKNVAGYDLMKLFVGARQSLGLVTSATFKLLPRPQMEIFLARECGDVGEAEAVTEAVLASATTPTVLDWHGAGRVVVVIAFAGEPADVRWQVEQVAGQGFAETPGPDHDADFFSGRASRPGHRSVLPSRLRLTVEALGGPPFLARAGNGTLWSDAIPDARRSTINPLEERLKALLDPQGLLPSLP